MLFLSGPCTEGPGICVDTDLATEMRGHSDIKGETPVAKYWSKSKQYYDSLATRLVANGHCVDAFLYALDQVGFAEMRSCVYLTGGTCLMDDSFASEKFSDSFEKFFNKDDQGKHKVFHKCQVEVHTSQHWKVAGATGPLNSADKKSPSVAQETVLGIGGTSEWLVSSLDERTHLAFYFEATNAPFDSTSPYRYVQFTTKYQHPDGTLRIRVTTACHAIAGQKMDPTKFVQYFDQNTSAVLMARLACHKAESQHIFDVLRWLDHNLIKLVSRFGTNKESNLTLAPKMSFFPQFMFHLRRSPFLQVFNSSPDETTFNRLWLDREDVNNALTMIQPALFGYTSQGGPTPLPLDVVSVLPDNILLLDTYFDVVVHYGETVVSWRNQGYQNNPDYAFFKDLLEKPKEHALEIVRSRYPQPRFVECDHHGSQARILYNVINPSRSSKKDNANPQEQYGTGGDEIVFTEDVSLQTFLQHLKALAAQS
eukprot:Sspe_Gene.4057::Locus_1334_Transcript_1_1_Confidence_1.000_Length_2376::g.4057::m.4057/K14006/SEC23; protein transport protein SEC23